MTKEEIYNKWEKKDLISYIIKLEDRKKYGLVWNEEKSVEQFSAESENRFPVLNQVKEKAIITDPAIPTNYLIEGDNFHLLSVLNYTHEKAIDIIYIDPPYNTGSNDFKYNDRYVDETDSYRHSKWLSFMQKRLELSKYLLKDSGVILVQIDENEIAQLRLLMDEVFGKENFRNCIVWAYRTGGAPRKNEVFSKKHDYILFYSKNKEYFQFNRLKEKIIYAKDFFGAKKDDQGNFFAEVNLRDVIEGEIELMKDGQVYKRINVKPVINLSSERVPDFPTQKPKGLMKYFFEILAPNNGIILDFFAGSGSTALSVMELNQEENKGLRFILCTNNENGICEDICYPRLKKAILGEKNNKEIPAIGGNLRYFTSSFISNEQTDSNKKNITEKSIEMLCLKEDTFNFYAKSKGWQIFQGVDHFTGILFDLKSISSFKNIIKTINQPIHIYVFSLANDTYDEEFSDLNIDFSLCAIPESILVVYRRIFK